MVIGDWGDLDPLTLAAHAVAHSEGVTLVT
jgi:hypothetical protein